jgi:hypothetical protein
MFAEIATSDLKIKLSQDKFRSLTQQQVHAINELLINPPTSLINIARQIPYEDFSEILASHGVALSAAEYPFDTLQYKFKQIYPRWLLSERDVALILRALSRYLFNSKLLN